MLQTKKIETNFTLICLMTLLLCTSSCAYKNTKIILFLYQSNSASVLKVYIVSKIGCQDYYI